MFYADLTKVIEVFSCSTAHVASLLLEKYPAYGLSYKLWMPMHTSYACSKTAEQQYSVYNATLHSSKRYCNLKVACKVVDLMHAAAAYPLPNLCLVHM